MGWGCSLATEEVASRLRSRPHPNPTPEGEGLTLPRFFLAGAADVALFGAVVADLLHEAARVAAGTDGGAAVGADAADVLHRVDAVGGGDEVGDGRFAQGCGNAVAVGFGAAGADDDLVGYTGGAGVRAE